MLEGEDPVAVEIRAIRTLAFWLIARHNSDQAWFWTPQWQARIAEAEADRMAGNSTVHASEESFLDALDGE